MKQLRNDFPFLHQRVDTKEIIYFDNSATTQKPQQVIDAIAHYYSYDNAPIHRSVYAAAEKTTQLYEQARARVAQFINAKPHEIIFTKGTTESINAVATAWATHTLKPDDEIVITELEHHSNLVPWQQVCKATGAKLTYIPITDEGTLILDNLHEIITNKTKLVAVSHVSNALGTHVDIARIIEAAHAVNALCLIDAAQSAPHQTIDVARLKPDFLVFGGHKMLAPTGIGVLYIAEHLHEIMQPYQFGGGMVFEVDKYVSTWLKAPQKFEAGTPPIAQAVGFKAALDYLSTHVDFDELQRHEAQLCAHLIDGLQSIAQVRLLGPLTQLKKNGHLVSFTIDGLHAHDVATYLGQQGVYMRAGHYCAQPLAKRLGLEASVRASFYCYNLLEEIDQLIILIEKLCSVPLF
ncbi:cysteine desulfurase [Candidatus Dependentiae bacterium Noda2021]|nr:cysteine desulfurase [Candidatus Dependentiae bacterium Noda2021]